MKKLDQFILKAFVLPFFAILSVVVFILILQFLWVYIDELVGKGLSLKIILEFMGWGGATMLPLALPLATLLASVMTIGNMAENSELIAMKAAGISLKRVMTPIMAASVVISIGTYFTVNNLVPVAYNKIYTLRDDIGKTKDEINIPTGTFYNGIDGYILRVDSRDKKTGMMHKVMVYDHTSNNGNRALTLADSATISMSKAKDYLSFKLYNGANYQETNTKKYRDTTLQLQKIEFATQEMIILLKDYAFKKSSNTRYSDQVKSMKMGQLFHGKDSVSAKRDSAFSSQFGGFLKERKLRHGEQLDTAATFVSKGKMKYPKTFDWPSYAKKRDAYIDVSSRAADMATVLRSDGNELYECDWLLRRINVELLKKFAQALMCLILFLIGAPLGSFNTKKGELGVWIIAAVMFFVLYWVVDITGIKLARDGALTAAAGVYLSTVVLLPLGLFLSWKAIHDSAVIKTENFGSWSRKIKSQIMGFFKRTRIVYMGTPEFAVAPLDALIKAKYNVVGVVTVADKPSGRGLKMNESAVKKYAVEHGIPVLQPLKLKDPDFLEALATWKADLFIVVAFRMLPEAVWKMPTLGTFNLHAALLPQYRGAAPINWAVINGERMTGATTFMIDKNIDTGGIMLRQECIIGENDTVGDVHDKLMEIGAELVLQTTEGLIENNIETRTQRSFIQGSEILKPAPKLTRELCDIDWRDTVAHIYNLIRGLSPYPTAFTMIEGAGLKEPAQLKIFSAAKVTGAEFEAMKVASKVSDNAELTSGTVLSDGKTFFAICALDGALSIKDLQLSGKKRMDAKAFLAGFRDPCAHQALCGTSKEEIDKTHVHA